MPPENTSGGAQPLTDADCPGYREAVAHENLVRGAAALGIRPRVCGHEVLPLTAFHVRHLVFVRSPFLFVGLTAAELAGTAEKKFEDAKPGILDDIMLFLWIVSPFYEQGSKTSPPKKWWRCQRPPTARDRFNTAFAPIMKEASGKVCREILDYIFEAYLDAGEGGGGSDKSYFADEISIACEMQPYGFRADFWNPNCPREKNPVHIPLQIVFQFRKHRRWKKGEMVGNKSEKLISLALERKNQREVESKKETAA